MGPERLSVDHLGLSGRTKTLADPGPEQCLSPRPAKGISRGRDNREHSHLSTMITKDLHAYSMLFNVIKGPTLKTMSSPPAGGGFPPRTPQGSRRGRDSERWRATLRQTNATIMMTTKTPAQLIGSES